MFVLVTCLLAISLTGCTTAGRMQKRGTTPQQQGATGVNPLGGTTGQGMRDGNLQGTTMLPGQPGIPGGNPTQGTLPGNNLSNTQGQQQVSIDRQKSDEIRNKLNGIAGVKDTSVAVRGNTCLVGYTPSGTAADVNATKANIIKRVKETDKSITDVRVSESADIMTRINKLSTDVTGSSPMNEITESFNKLMQEITPKS